MPNTAPKDKTENKPNQPTALVAGGAGFIGSHLITTLISQNFRVICVDNFSTGKKKNLKEVLTSPNFTLVEADLNDPKFSLPEGVKIDYCFHLASIEDYLNKGLSLDTLLVNSLGTRQLLEIARSQTAKFILVSAADLYSGAISSSSLRYYFGSTNEQEAVLSAHEAKRFSEALAFEYYKKYKLQLTIIRLKDAYGPRMNLDRGDQISNLFKKALAKETLEVEGDGLKIINPTFVSDIVFGLIKASVGDFSGEIFILVNPEKITLESFAQTLKLVAGPLEIEHTREKESFDFNSQHFDLENTKEKLGWKPKVTLAEGISSVIHQVQIEESKKEPSEDQEKAVEERVEERLEKEKPRKNFKFLRIIIFLLATGLLVATLVYPLISFAFNSFSGKGKLQQAYQELLAENNESAAKEAFSAQESFQDASNALANLNWLSKIVGLSEESSAANKVLAISGSLTEAIRLSSRANQILLNSAENEKLTSSEAKESLNEVLDNLYAANDRLAEVQLGLSEVNWQEVPDSLVTKKEFLETTHASLSKQVSDLITTIEENLAKTSASD